MVKSHANTVVLELIVRIPNIQVSPRRGSRTTEAMNSDLFNNSNNTDHQNSPGIHSLKYIFAEV